MRLLTQQERGLQAYIVSLVPHWTDADDILQETKIKLWEKFATYDETGDFGAWARRIAHFEILTHRGKVRRERARLSQETLDLVAESAAAAAGEVESRYRALADCLNKLSDAGRDLLWRCYSGGAAVKDVAVSLGRSVRGTQRAVAKLRFTVLQCVERTVQREDRR